MQILVERPPNYSAIAAAFPIAGRKVIFAWGDCIYNPHNIAIGPELLAHEAVHGSRMRQAPFLWWQRYIEDPAFRLHEETLAHAAEVITLLRMHGNNRNNRRRFEAYVAGKLASPLYGPMVTNKKARELLAA